MSAGWKSLFVGIVLATLPSVAAAESPESAPSEPLPPLTRRLVSMNILQTKTGFVHVPDGAPKRSEWAGLPHAKIISMHGRSPTDLWFLTADQIVIHDDGKRIVDRYARPCGWGSFEGEYTGLGTRFFQVVVDKDAVHVIGESRGINTRVGSEVAAILSKSGKWSCKETQLVPAFVTSSGDYTWKIAHNMDGDLCRVRGSTGFCTSGPRWAPSFSEPSTDSIDMGIQSITLRMFGLDDGFIVTRDDTYSPTLHRFNGVTWAPVAKIDRGIRVTDMWADEDRNVWLMTSGPVLRYDGSALRPLPVSSSFVAGSVRGTGPRDVWFFGGGRKKVYQWDGDKLREGSLPFEPSDGWASPHGEVWFAGSEGVAFTAPLAEAR